MNKTFYDICYEVLSHYLHFPDVADTYKSINDGLDYMRNFPQDIWNFKTEKGEIISCIQTMRLNNTIDAYQDPSNMLLLVPVPSGKPLAGANPEELYNNPAGEIPRLVQATIIERKGDFMAKQTNSLAHTKWIWKYHIIFTPKRSTNAPLGAATSQKQCGLNEALRRPPKAGSQGLESQRLEARPSRAGLEPASRANRFTGGGDLEP